MAKLTGGGDWLTLQKNPIGTVTVGRFISYEKDVPSSNPALPPQSVLTIDQGNGPRKVGCPTALKRIFDKNAASLRPGEQLAITYEGPKKGKSPLPFHSFSVETLEAFDPQRLEDGSLEFPPAANEPDPELERRIAEARARRAA